MSTWLCLTLCLVISVTASTSKDITSDVFGNVKNVLPAAFGDFNSDALIDMFVLTNDHKSFRILLAENEPPLFRSSELTCSFDNIIANIVPGDFNGDALMDVMVTTFVNTTIYKVHIFWGHINTLDCKPGITFLTTGQPLAIDYNQDMIIDLFGEDENGKRTFWIFNSNGTEPKRIVMSSPELKELAQIKIPHSNAFLNLRPTENFLPDLVVSTANYYEIWRGTDNGFEYNRKITKPQQAVQVGQFLYLDVQLACQLDLVVPICYSKSCDNATIAVNAKDTWYHLELIDSTNTKWSFPNDENGGISNVPYNTQTLRGGDFNLDGYPDLLATLMVGNQLKSVLLQNVECVSNCKGFSRTFEIMWDALTPFSNGSVMAAFYDFNQNGILDVILVLKQNTNDYRIAALQNTMDYDANFVKVMIITGRTNDQYPIAAGSIGQKKRTYGTNLPGPSISYKTTTQDGMARCGVAAQLPQSAHHVLALPFTTFGLGRTPNFIDSLVGRVATLHHEYPQIIPNSQLVIIPNPMDDASGWKAQLFITPSDLILQSAIALAGVCVLIMLIILGLYWKERRQDKIEKLQEAHRFHFDAM